MPVDTVLEKPLPNNLDAERSILGAILLDNHALNTAIENVRPEDFFLDQHRRVFTQMIALGDSQQRALEGEDGADMILDNAESSIFALAEDRVKAGLIPVKDIVRDNFERLERIFREGKSITGISTGYGELDKLTSGLQPSELLILAARPSQGKTALALNLAENIAIRGGHPVAVFSLEMF